MSTRPWCWEIFLNENGNPHRTTKWIIDHFYQKANRVCSGKDYADYVDVDLAKIMEIWQKTMRSTNIQIIEAKDIGNPQKLIELRIRFRKYPAGNYMFKVKNRNTRTRCEICSKLIIKTPNLGWIQKKLVDDFKYPNLESWAIGNTKLHISHLNKEP